MALTLLTPSPHQPCRGCILGMDLVEDTEAQRLCGFFKVRQTRSPLRVGRKSSCFLTLSEMAGPLCSHPLPQETWRAWKTAWRRGQKGEGTAFPRTCQGSGAELAFHGITQPVFVRCPVQPRLTCGSLLSSHRRAGWALGPLPSQGDRAPARSVRDPDSGLQFCAPHTDVLGLRVPAHSLTLLFDASFSARIFFIYVNTHTGPKKLASCRRHTMKPTVQSPRVAEP